MGIQSTLVQDKKGKSTLNQIYDVRVYDVRVYDLIFDVLHDHTALLISKLFGSLAKHKILKISKQLRRCT